MVHRSLKFLFTNVNRVNSLTSVGLNASPLKGVCFVTKAISIFDKEETGESDTIRRLIVRPLLFLNLISKKQSPEAR